MCHVLFSDCVASVFYQIVSNNTCHLPRQIDKHFDYIIFIYMFPTRFHSSMCFTGFPPRFTVSLKGVYFSIRRASKYGRCCHKQRPCPLIDKFFAPFIAVDDARLHCSFSTIGSTNSHLVFFTYILAILTNMLMRVC
jgi:hypothetical protein